MSTKKNLSDWEKLIHACRSSGLTVRPWCLQKGISTSSFYYNAKKLRNQACKLAVSTGRTTTEVDHEVVRVTLLDEEPAPIAESVLAEVELPAICLQMNGVRMDINNHAQASLIAVTLQTLKQLC